MEINLVALIVAVVGAGGFGVFAREIVSVVTLVRNGVSAKESRRKNDLVAQRDYEYDRAETEAMNRRILAEHVSELRRLLIENGLASIIPKWPDLKKIPPRPAEPATAPTKETS
ncbi:hypothetical protein SCB71_14330 [Herbiconiux sp. KACC 21604]|uniref:hypothetical protein n=1 Tax=unclassified Herbiconiux TaxID=2618217 RepID=UPI0014920A16|nr:hypothetical protein [Herbiconiux sp. SALV-R1]QJU54319.1 hypothetical protein HL652_12270 [Herbiconiux sp. SALV-R1]WPO85389.1 hypothetical protein SCB71_14330 [Herbiconiux sp. KACC 21604]